MKHHLLIDLCLGTFDVREVRNADPAPLLEKANQLHLESYLLQSLGPVQQQLGKHAERWLPRLRQVVATNTLANLKADRVTSEILKRLHAREIPVMLLKGSALRARRPEFMGRFQGDVDLLVQRDSVDGAEEALLILGFAFTPGIWDYDFYRAHHFHLPFERDGARVELHWNVDQQAPDGFVQRLFDGSRTVEFENGITRTPSPEHEVLLSLIHVSRHAFFEGLRWMADLSHLMPWPESLQAQVEREAQFWPRRTVALPLWWLARRGVRGVPISGDCIDANLLDRVLVSRLVEYHLLGETWPGLPSWMSHHLTHSWMGSSKSLAGPLMRLAGSALSRRIPGRKQTRH